ncbi:unnamed protein product [Rhizophagus irregularis]|nr:unnamed protein product [Rhizophagus irregularis]CAB5371387.1 unnamed protein product [Rhizophagus irregularis]
MNEFMSEEITYNDISHDNNLAVKICKGFRPKISEDTPKLIADLIIKCWDAKAENRPTAKELRQIIFKYDKEKEDENKPVNSTDYLSSFQETISPSSANPISECLDCELNELDLNQDDDE